MPYFQSTQCNFMQKAQTISKNHSPLFSSLFPRYSSEDTPSLLHINSIASPSFRWSIDGVSMEYRWRNLRVSSKDIREISDGNTFHLYSHTSIIYILLSIIATWHQLIFTQISQSAYKPNEFHSLQTPLLRETFYL